MFISPELEYPLVCLGVRRGDEKTPLNFDIINLNSGSSWFTDLETLKGEFTNVCDFCLHKMGAVYLINLHE